MIITVTPNASVDKTYLVEGFGVDRINRPSESWTSSGGKGVNVARVLKELGSNEDFAREVAAAEAHRDDG